MSFHYQCCTQQDLAAWGFQEQVYNRTRIEPCPGGYVLHVNPPAPLKSPLGSFHLYTDFQRVLLFLPSGNQAPPTLPPSEETIPLTILRLLFQTISQDMNTLEHMESQLSTLEDSVFSNREDLNFSRRLIRIRRNIIHLRQYYEQMIEILAVMEESKLAHEGEELTWLHRLDRRCDRLFSLLTDLREYSLNVQDAYQSKNDYNLNNLMKTLTILTTIMLPLQLITGWFGMNLMMPEFESPLAYPIVIILCIVIILLCTFFFKKKKWL